VRAQVAAKLAAEIRAHADTRVARLVAWGNAYQYHMAQGDSVTAAKSWADVACANLDGELARLHGEIEALRVELEQIDFEEARS
jgi:hypothetical protein